MESRWITTIGPTTCVACRKRIPAGHHVYSLIGSEAIVYCLRCGPRAEESMRRNAEHKERERRITLGLPA